MSLHRTGKGGTKKKKNSMCGFASFSIFLRDAEFKQVLSFKSISVLVCGGFM